MSNKKLREIDIMAIIHDHFDHVSGVNGIAHQNENVLVIAKLENTFPLKRRGVKDVIPINIAKTSIFQRVKSSIVSAFHTSTGIDQLGKTGMAGTAVGYIIGFGNSTYFT